MFEDPVVLLTAIGVIGMICQWLAWRFKIPAILLLLLAGIAVGPVTGTIQPHQIFGDLLFPIVSLGVAVVLFEGSLSLRFHEIRDLAGVVRNLVTLGAVVTWFIMAGAVHWLVGFPWELAFLFGALVVVTGPTVVVPMLRTIRPTSKITNVLRWEGIIIDPLGALLAVLVFEFIISGSRGGTLWVFPMMLLSGTLIGLAAGLFLGHVLRRHLLPHFLVNVTTLVLVLSAFTFANLIEHESGLLAVTVMGLVLANQDDVSIAEVVDFKESLSVMIMSALFIILAARIEVRQLLQLGWPAIGVLAILLFAARPLAVAVSAYRSKLDWRERAVVAWIAPRGIVAAAVSAVFGLRLEAEVPDAELLVPLTFLMIIGTVVLQGISARRLAILLKVAEPEPNGVLIVGAHVVARAIARVLVDKGFRVIVADTNWNDIRTARMDGLHTYFGNVVSEHAERNLELMGIGRLFAMTERPAFNALACVNYRNEFGADRVYALKTREEEGQAQKTAIARQYASVHLFGEDVTLEQLREGLEAGGELRTTHLTENFDFDGYRAKYHGQAVALLAINKRDCLRVFTADDTLEPGPGWSIIGLLPVDLLMQTEEGTTEKKAEVRKAEHTKK